MNSYNNSQCTSLCLSGPTTNNNTIQDSAELAELVEEEEINKSFVVGSADKTTGGGGRQQTDRLLSEKTDSNWRGPWIRTGTILCLVAAIDVKFPNASRVLFS
jgi:hypothetical protein